MSEHTSSDGSTATTRGVRVEVVPEFLGQCLKTGRAMWVHAYHVSITNEGTETVQLVTRHWIITNGMGEVKEVQGPGVVGEQPILEPGESYEYSSGCPMDTSMGTMHGTYQMVTADGEEFDAEIAPFTLAEPWSLN